MVEICTYTRRGRETTRMTDFLAKEESSKVSKTAKDYNFFERVEKKKTENFCLLL